MQAAAETPRPPALARACVLATSVRTRTLAATATLAACAATAVLAADPAGARTTASPTARQVAAAIRADEHSRSLWATINACARTRHHDVMVGVRGQMPTASFPVRLQMTLSALYYSSSSHTYLPLRGSSQQIPLGVYSGGTVQGGIAYTLRAPVDVIGKITFSWVRDGRVIGSVTRETTAGHHDVQDGHPARYSAASCSVKS